MKSADWWPCFDAGTTDAEAREEAAAKLDVPEEQVELWRTGGAALTRERRGEANEN